MHSGSDLAAQFGALSDVLRATEDWWRESPFCVPRPRWCAQQPSLMQRVLALSDAEVAALEQSPDQLQVFFQDVIPQLGLLHTLIDLPVSTQSETFPERWSVDVPGRKWQQVSAFIGALRAGGLKSGNSPVLDWCAGKSHLGRTLARHRSVPLRALERDAALCEAGETLAQKQGVSARFQCADVLRDPVMLRMEEQVVALHACGDLHRSLLKQVVAQSVRRVALSPCCYHLWVAERYTPLSQQAQHADLQLDLRCLHLAMEEAVTSSLRTLGQHLQLQVWRLGFDCLQRQLRASDDYFSTPSLPMSAAKTSFETVARQFAVHKKLPLPAAVNWAWFERRGLMRWREVQRLQLVRHAFRRALEIWLALDLALFMEENGYRSQLSVFCARDLTPRNLLLQAERQ